MLGNSESWRGFWRMTRGQVCPWAILSSRQLSVPAPVVVAAKSTPTPANPASTPANPAPLLTAVTTKAKAAPNRGALRPPLLRWRQLQLHFDPLPKLRHLYSSLVHTFRRWSRLVWWGSVCSGQSLLPFLVSLWHAMQHGWVLWLAQAFLCLCFCILYVLVKYGNLLSHVAWWFCLFFIAFFDRVGRCITVWDPESWVVGDTSSVGQEQMERCGLELPMVFGDHL